MSSASVAAENTTIAVRGRDSLWSKAFYKFRHDRMGMVAFALVMAYGVMALGTVFGWWANDWSEIRGGRFDPISADFWFGSNVNGQDIFARTVFSTRTAFEVGLVVAILSTLIGAVLGAVAGYYSGSWIDELVLWLKGVLDSIPFYLFVAAVAFAMQGSAYGMHVAMVATFWTTTGRLVRGEVIKLKQFEFVEAARAIGLPELKIVFRHIIPNTFHILLVQATIVFVAAIKSEVILSFLGLGVKNGVSWGRMLAEATYEVGAGHFNNFIWASLFMFGLVMAFNMFSDALQDALDPRKV
ncbi:MAG: ABC transporter permease [Gammaproteobacteria bacterium]|nr:ABC transporter permease [Gammaproteobacteria bacterium]